MAKQSWRQGRSSTPARAKRSKPAPVTAPPASRSRAMGVLGFLLLLLVTALLVAVIGWLNPVPPPQVAVISARYISPEIPVNEYALHDARAFSQQRHLFDFMGSDADSLNRDELRGVIESLKEFRPAPFWFPWRKTTAIVYVNALGAVLPRDAAISSEWQACLLADDFAVPTQTHSVADLNAVPVRDLLASITSSSADYRLVILDCQKTGHLYPAGANGNAFAEAVRIELGRLDPAQRKGLFVLFSCGPGQTAWANGTFGQSIFGYHLVRGLTGMADTAGGNSDGRVSLQELFDYVSTNVDRWAQSHRVDLQLPELIAFGQETANVTVVSTQTSSGFRPPPTAESTSEAVVTEQLRDAWEKTYRLLAESPAPYEFAPAEWNHLLATVQQAERLLRGGYFDDAQQQLAELRFRDEALVQARQRMRLEPNAYSLGMADFVQRCNLLASGARPLFAPPSPAEATAETDGEEKPATADSKGANPARSDPSMPLADVAAIVENTAASRQPLPEAAKLLAEIRQTRGTLPIEAHLIRMLDEFRPAVREGEAAQLAAALKLLEQRKSAEAALVAAADYLPETLPWIRAAAQEADRNRRFAEDRYFAEGGGTVLTLGNVGAIPGETQIADSFREIAALSQIVSQALRLRNRLCFELPHLVRYCASRDWTWTPESEADAARIPEESLKFRGDVIARTRELMRSAHAFEQTLRRDVSALTAAETSAHVRELQQQTTALATLHSALMRRIQDTLAELAETNATLVTRNDWRRIDDLLQLPFPADAADASAATETRMVLLGLSRGGVARPEDKHLMTAGDRSADEARIRVAVEKEQAHRQMVTPLVASLYAWPAMQPVPADFADRDEAQKALSKLWSEQFLSASLGVAERRQLADEKLVTMDAACRLLDGRVAVHYGPYWSAELLRQRRLSELFAWQASRFGEDFWNGAAGDPEPYFLTTAGSYLAAAQRLAGDDDPQRRAAASRIAELQQVASGLRVEFDPGRVVFRGTDRERIQVDVDVPAGCPPGLARVAVQTPAGSVELQQLIAADGAALRQFELTRKTPAPGSLQGTASLLFRGHLLPRELPVVLVDELNGIQVSYRNEREAPPQVVVRPLDIDSDQLKLLFVLDCSRSMALPDGPEANASRRIITLRNMLQRFADETPSHALDVGVRLLGDQVVWVKGDAASEEAARKDTRLVLPIGPFNRGKLKSVLPSLSPKGETPLFQALLAAREDFAAIKGGRKRIIVISDGADNWAPFGLAPGMDELREAYRGSDISISAIGFQVAQSEFQQLVEICRATGGTAVRADNAQQLFNQVTGLAGFLKFAIFSGSRRYPAEGEPLPSLGSDTEPMTVDPGKIDIRVLNPAGQIAAEMKNVEISAGEKHELFYESGRLRYAPGVSYRPRMVQVDPQTQAELIVLRADRRESGLQLQLTVRNPPAANWQPERLTLRVESVGSSERRDYVVHNLRPNVAGYHFPVWNCLLENWPPRSEAAALEVRFSRAEPEGVMSIPLDWDGGTTPLRLRDGILLTRYVFKQEPFLGEERGVVTVTLAFPQDRLDLQDWSAGFAEKIQAARETYNLGDRVYTGQFVLNPESKPRRLLLYGPDQIPRELSIECEVPIKLGKIN